MAFAQPRNSKSPAPITPGSCSPLRTGSPEELAGLEIREPSVPVVCNHEARVVAGPDEIRRTLVAQVTGSVRWWESMKVFLEQGQTRFIEFGPGGVLANLMKRIDRGAEVISVTDVPSLQIAMEKLNPSG